LIAARTAQPPRTSLDRTCGPGYHCIMGRDPDRLRAALGSPRSEAARDAALALGAAGTLDDVARLEAARAEARRYYAELARPCPGDEFDAIVAEARDARRSSPPRGRATGPS
jgi:hypothetical protein